MKTRVTPLLFYRVLICLLVAGARHGIPLIAGVVLAIISPCLGYVLLFLLLVLIVGGIYASLVGLVTGIIGCALGGRRGWALAGAVSLAVPAAGICRELQIDYWETTYLHPTAAGAASALPGFVVAVCIVAAIGTALGFWYGKAVPDPLINLRTGAILTWKDARDATSRSNPDLVALTNVPLAVRLSAAATVLVLIVGVIWDAVRILLALYTGH